MKQMHMALAALIVVLVAVIAGCPRDAEPTETQDTGPLTASRGEHDRDGSERGGEGKGEHDEDGEGGHGEEGEESGTTLTLDETYDDVRNGARLVLAYDAEGNSFQGTVENTTEETLERVRVEVHLSNGIELGPTTPADLEPGEKRDVSLTAESTDFNRWSAHPEVGAGEHGQEEGHGEL